MQAEHERDTADHGAEEPEERNRTQGRGETHPALAPGDAPYGDPEKEKDHRDCCHREEHVPFRKKHSDDKGDTGNWGDKDENIPEIGNDRGKVPEPPHHYWVTATTLLVFANAEGHQTRSRRRPSGFRPNLMGSSILSGSKNPDEFFSSSWF
jgi:hypothetical protein